MSGADEALERLKSPEQSQAFKDPALLTSVDALRDAAVAMGDEVSATECWKAETIAIAQRRFDQAFQLLRGGRFYDAWCELERCEINLGNLLRHHTPDATDPHRILYMDRMVSQWQGLFPYATFFSPEFVKLRVECGTCGAVVRPRNNCGHRKGQIYHGRLCIHKIAQVQMLSISIVINPVQKYSVAFLTDDQGERIDHFNYGNVKFIADRLVSPWHSWRTTTTTRELTSSEVAHVSPSAPCPCLSKKLFGDCCQGKETVTAPHLQINFAVPPPRNLPELELLF